MTRLHRVHAFCDWLETIPPEWPPFEAPGFDQFRDLTDGELLAARIERRRREAARPANDDQPEPPEAA